jgi:hypothetical protein
VSGESNHIGSRRVAALDAALPPGPMSDNFQFTAVLDVESESYKPV